MTSDLLDLAALAAAHVRDARSIRARIHAAAAFIDVLGTVPDQPANALSAPLRFSHRRK